MPECSRWFYIIKEANKKVVGQKFGIHKRDGIYCIVFEYIYFSEVMCHKLFKRAIRTLGALEPNDTIIQ